ncbi:MAG: hypothetical protein ACI8TX_001630 [Hyphomicrobiaceae bacterium]|jgi:hypothetical protein
MRETVGDQGQVETCSYSLSPDYEWTRGNDRQKRILKGYIATNQVLVTTSDLASAGTLIDGAVTAGGIFGRGPWSAFEGFDFQHRWLTAGCRARRHDGGVGQRREHPDRRRRYPGSGVGERAFRGSVKRESPSIWLCLGCPEWAIGE